LRSLWKSILVTPGLALGLVLAGPVLAQDADNKSDDKAAGKMTQEQLDSFAGMMAGLFQAEPLTAEQEARLPAAQAVVGVMMPDGFYGEMMGDMMDKMVRPMMSMFSSPEFLLSTRLELSQDEIDALEQAEKIEIMTMLDPAYGQRGDAIVNVMMGKMGGMFGAMEGPMREGLSKAYAVRFDGAQLNDIATFFATPSGSIYARESMALFADPQVMQASMQALPAMMSGIGDMESAMMEAMGSLPGERAYEDLSGEERDRLAELLEVGAASLPDLVKPPKPAGGMGH